MYTRSLFSQWPRATTIVKAVSTITPPSLNRKRPKDVFSSIGGGGGGVCGEGGVSKPLLIIKYPPVGGLVLGLYAVFAFRPKTRADPRFLKQLLSCFWMILSVYYVILRCLILLSYDVFINLILLFMRI